MAESHLISLLLYSNKIPLNGYCLYPSVIEFSVFAQDTFLKGEKNIVDKRWPIDETIYLCKTRSDEELKINITYNFLEHIGCYSNVRGGTECCALLSHALPDYFIFLYARGISVC